MGFLDALSARVRFERVRFERVRFERVRIASANETA